jgi:hypothetical protein
MAPDEDDGARFIAYRLDQIEKRIETMQTHFDGRLDNVQGSIGTLPLMRKDVYDAAHKALEDKVNSAHALAMWALGTTLSVVVALGSLTAILKLVAG